MVLLLVFVVEFDEVVVGVVDVRRAGELFLVDLVEVGVVVFELVLSASEFPELVKSKGYKEV